jgi:hypothetical protein
MFYRYRIYRYRVYNHPEIERLKESINRYREDIEAGRAFIKVEGTCSGHATIAKIRSNHVKSEMILGSGLKESHFYTVNHANVTDSPTDIVVVTVPVWISELPPQKGKTVAPSEKSSTPVAATASPEPPTPSMRQVTGLITDESGRPLGKVAVYTTPPLTATDSKGNGRFTLALPQDVQGQYLYFSSDGYQTDSVWLTGNESSLQIRLKNAIPAPDKSLRSVTGKIIDENNQPLGEVNVYTKNPMRGTSSNSEGRFTFTFPQDFQEQYLYFTSIGNKTDSVWLTGTDTLLLVQLKPDIQQTVTASADSASLAENDTTVVPSRPKLNTKVLLNRAYDHISNNYPNKPAHYDVFYRETNKTVDGKYVAVAEAMLDVYKNSYDKPKDKGQVRIEKSRKSIIPLYDSIVYMHFYGGAFAFIAKDHVLVRSKVIDPVYYSDFKYTQEEMTRFDGRDVYVVGFSDRKEDIHGKLYIEADNYAYVRIEINTARTIHDDGLDRSMISETVQYIPHKDGKWHLNQIKYTDQKKIYSTGMVFDNSIEHVAVQINTENAAPIPKKQQLSYRDPFYMMAENYHPDYWDGYNVLQQDSTLQQTLESLHTTEEINQVMTGGFDKAEVDELMEQVRENQGKNLIVMKHDSKTNRMKTQFEWKQFHKKLYGGAGIHYQGITAARGKYAFDYPISGNTLSFRQDRTIKKLPYGLDILLGIHLTDRWSIYWTGSGNPLTKQLKIGNHQIGAEYRFALKEGTPLFLGFSAAFGWGRYFADFGTIDNSLGTFVSEGKTIDAKRLNIRGGFKQTSLTPGISLTGKINEIFEIELYVKYHQRVTHQAVNRIREKDGFFLTRKQVTIGSDYLQVTQDNGTRLEKFVDVVPFQVGVLLRFR